MNNAIRSQNPVSLNFKDLSIDPISLPGEAFEKEATRPEEVSRMSPQNLASIIAKKEGHNSQSRIGDIREIISILADLSYQSPAAVQTIIKLGIARAKRKSRAPSKK